MLFSSLRSMLVCSNSEKAMKMCEWVSSGCRVCKCEQSLLVHFCTAFAHCERSHRIFTFSTLCKFSSLLWCTLFFSHLFPCVFFLMDVQRREQAHKRTKTNGYSCDYSVYSYFIVRLILEYSHYFKLFSASIVINTSYAFILLQIAKRNYMQAICILLVWQLRSIGFLGSNDTHF